MVMFLVMLIGPPVTCTRGTVEMKMILSPLLERATSARSVAVALSADDVTVNVVCTVRVSIASSRSRVERGRLAAARCTGRRVLPSRMNLYQDHFMDELLQIRNRCLFSVPRRPLLALYKLAWLPREQAPRSAP